MFILCVLSFLDRFERKVEIRSVHAIRRSTPLHERMGRGKKSTELLQGTDIRRILKAVLLSI
jgi:hypothetical protein